MLFFAFDFLKMQMVADRDEGRTWVEGRTGWVNINIEIRLISKEISLSEHEDI